MDARVNVITLAVDDVDRARQFYVDGLGWTPSVEVSGEVVFVPITPTLMLSLWRREAFEQEVGSAAAAGSSPIVLAHNVPTPEAVDDALEAAVRAGGSVLRPAEHREWGGYSGYLADVDGYRWEVAYNPGPLGVALMQGEGLA
ncbi:VOC family protein [Chryseoglobus sp. 28M-23]|uniref:VOC family protein n=1 Tax=Chryseoglobus sp. 28M-23 TaxID=2772253 RepID=UPI0017469CDF|nr:VOC family protein [Chryseoglobus sp. 28M-23]QOD92761.1 VOC family protein [Chryseoglobus sp. 28M-23]